MSAFSGCRKRAEQPVLKCDFSWQCFGSGLADGDLNKL